MSQENIEVVRSAFEALSAGDDAGFVAAWTPDCEFFSVTGSQIDGAPYRGIDGIRRYLVEVAEMWSKLRFEPERILEGSDGDVVVVVGWLRGEGRGSHIEVEQKIGIVSELRDQKVYYCRSYRDPAEALEAAGLSD